MARGFLSALNKIAREAERASKTRAREHARAIRNTERSQKAQERFWRASAKEQKRLSIDTHFSEVEDMNQSLEQHITDLENLLIDSLESDCVIDFDAMKKEPSVAPLNLEQLQNVTPLPDRLKYIPEKPHPLIGWLPPVQKNYEDKLAKADRAFSAAMAEYERMEDERSKSIQTKREEYQQKVQKAQAYADRHNAEIDTWRVAFESGEKEAVEEYFEMVLVNSAYPKGFLQETKVAYVKNSKQLVLEYDLPTIDAIIPKEKSFTFVKSTNKVSTAMRPEKQRRILYASVVAQVTLRCLYELFSSDGGRLVDTIVFNGFVNTINPGDGQEIRPCLVTVRATRDQFLSINLRKAEAPAALQTLNASFSKSPAELAPVRPLLEFNMVDSRFIKESDVLSTLDQRPNLMDLSPGEFESLITNLFQKMGLETKLTQASRDGGVDCVAYDPRPIFGGKVVIQAKRYKNTVGVSAVRDLFGTMQNEGASKGILVATSGYGKAAFEFANGKPMELLDGGNLLYLLKEHAGIDAKIVMPEDWKDPVGDMA